ncbi:MAG: YdcF family protein [Kiloniellales bacterium]|nr:YdcF family protein [Kiloniellales bacterium]
MEPVQLAAKAVSFLVQPGNLLLLVLLLGTLFAWLRPRRSGRAWLTGLTAALLFVAVAPVDDWIARPLEDRFPAPAVLPGEVDGILVLGGIVQRPVADERGALAVNESAERLIALAALARRYPEARLVVTGRGEDHPALTAWFAGIGLDPGRLEFEPAARNTFENAVFSQRLLDPGPEQVWLLVTSARHMPQAIGVFRKIGWPVVAYPVDYQTGGPARWDTWPDLAGKLADIGAALKEWVGLLAYSWLDRSDEPWPAPRDR